MSQDLFTTRPAQSPILLDFVVITSHRRWCVEDVIGIVPHLDGVEAGIIRAVESLFPVRLVRIGLERSVY